MFGLSERSLRVVALTGLLGGSLALSASRATGTAQAVGDSCASSAVGTVVVCNLQAPRHLQFGADGALYVAEAGNGSGDNAPACSTAAGCMGNTSDIARIANATTASNISMPPRWATGFPSVVSSAEGSPEATGLAGVAPYGSPATNPNPSLAGRIPVAAVSQFGPLYYIDPSGAAHKQLADFAAYEAANDPDKLGVDSDPYAVAWTTPGKLAVSDAAGDDLLATSLLSTGLNVGAPKPNSTSNIKLLSVFPEYPAGSACYLPPDPPGGHAAPTSVAYFGGYLYVGQLAGFNPGCARVFRVPVAGGAPQTVASGFFAVTDVAFDTAGNLYVLQFATGEIDQVAPGGARSTIVCPGGLVTPTGLTVGPDGNLYVSNFGDVYPGTGEVLRIAPTPVQGGCAKGSAARHA